MFVFSFSFFDLPVKRFKKLICDLSKKKQGNMHFKFNQIPMVCHSSSFGSFRFGGGIAAALPDVCASIRGALNRFVSVGGGFDVVDGVVVDDGVVVVRGAFEPSLGARARPLCGCIMFIVEIDKCPTSNLRCFCLLLIAFAF